MSPLKFPLPLTIACGVFVSLNGSPCLAGEQLPQSSRATTMPNALEINPQLLPALFSPLARLIPAPYANPHAGEDALSRERAFSANLAEIPFISTRPEFAALSTTTLVESFNTVGIAPEIRFPNARDFVLPSNSLLRDERAAQPFGAEVGRSLTILAK